MYSTTYLEGADFAFEQGLAAGSIFTAMASLFATYAIVITVLAVLGIIATWKIYIKAGKPGWAAIVPIYNLVVLFQIVGLNPWLILITIIPVAGWIAGIVFAIMIPFRLAKSFDKSIGWGFGLWLLPSIFQLILAFGNSEYVGPNGEDNEEKVEAKIVKE